MIPRSQRQSNRENGRIIKTEKGRRTGSRFRLHPALFFHGDIRDSRNMTLFAGNKPFYLQIYLRMVDSRNQWRWRLWVMSSWANKISCSGLPVSRHLAMVSTEADNVICHTHSWVLNVTANRESRYHMDWKLCPAAFQAVKNLWGPTELDLFASRFTKQLHRSVICKPDPQFEAE